MFDLQKRDQAKEAAQGKPRQSDSVLDRKGVPQHNPRWQSLAMRPSFMQAKLTISQHNDPHEQEADQMAQRVAHLPEPHLQRACACGGGCSGCQTEQIGQEHERLRTKRVGSSESGQAAEAPPIVHEVLAAPGHPLDTSTRGFMESRFGHDFSQVRAHTDAKAAESAGAVNALAYTVGRDVVFGAGQYQPNTGAGRQLLAHELSHTIQQGAAPRQELQQHPSREGRIQAQPVKTPVLARQPRPGTVRGRHTLDNRQLKSELHPTGKSHLYADQVASVYFASKNNILDQDDNLVLKALAQEYVYTTQRKGGLKGKIIGHADVEMSSDPDNQELSFQRARWTRAIFKSYLSDMAKVSPSDLQIEIEGAGSGYCEGDPECKGKVRPDALAQYRRADVMIFTEQTPNPQVTSCPPASGNAVKTLGEYIELISCAEAKTGYSPTQMLAMLRQMYYGKDWSATSPDPNWKSVIPCSPDLGNPKAKLGDTLYEALHNSDTVEGTDLGHVFTGLEAMTCPSSSVTISKSKLGMGIDLTVDMSNESFATWGGDLGAAAGAMTACWMMTNDERARKTKDCHQGNSPKGLIYYFTDIHAPARDLEGDIAPFVMRAAEGAGCVNSLETRFTPQYPISRTFKDFFYNRSPAGRASKGRYQCFAEAIGAKVVNGKIENRPELLNKYDKKVLSFAWAFYVNLKHEIPRSDPVVQTLLRHSQGALNLFFDWLQARMRE